MAQHRFLAASSLACPGASWRLCENLAVAAQRERDRAGEPTAPTWYAATMVRGARARRRSTIDLDVDVCVIGGGLAGPDRRARARAARLVGRGAGGAARRLERVRAQRRLRAAGLCRAHRTRSSSRVGLDHAKELWALSEAGVEYVRSDDPRDRHAGRRSGDGGWLDVSKTDDGDELLEPCRAAAAGFRRRGRGLADRAGARGARRPSTISTRCISRAPSTSIRSIMRSALRPRRKRPARASSRTRRRSSIDPAGVRKRIATPHGAVRADHVVLAGNVHLGALDAAIAATCCRSRPMWSATAPLGDRLLEAIALPRRGQRHRLADNHYRIVGGDRLLWSRTRAPPGTPIRGAMRTRCRRDIAQRLSRSSARSRSSMPGPARSAMRVHRMPQIGELSPGLWLASGVRRPRAQHHRDGRRA